MGFVVALAFIGFAVLLEAVDEGGNDRGRLTHNRQSLCVSVSVPPEDTPFLIRNHAAFYENETL